MTRTARSLAGGVLAAALLAGSLTACSTAATPTTGPSGSAAADKLSVAYWNYGPSAESSNKALAEGFEKSNPGITVNLVPIAGDNWGGYYANLATLIGSGEKPDLALTASEGIKFLSENKLIVPVNDYLDSKDSAALTADIAPALLDAFALNGQRVAVPNQWNNMVIYYNTKLFDDAGLDYPSANWTWDDFKKTAKALTKDTDSDGKNDQYGFTWASNEIFPGILPWVANAGGNLVNDDVSDATANSEPVVTAVSYLNDLIVEGTAPAPSPMGDIFSAFQNGKVAMFGGGRWPSATLLRNGFTSWDIQLYPTGATYKTVVGAAGYAILTSAASPDLAWQFQKYTSSPAVEDAEIGTPKAPRDSIPSLRSTAKKTVDAGIPPKNGALFYDSVDKYPALTPFPAPAKYSEYESTVLRHLQQIFAQEVDVKAGLEALQADLSATIKS